MHQDITVEVEEIRSVATGDHGSIDYRGTMGVSGTGHILNRLTFNWEGGSISFRGRAREVAELIDKIAGLRDQVWIGPVRKVAP